MLICSAASGCQEGQRDAKSFLNRRKFRLELPDGGLARRHSSLVREDYYPVAICNERLQLRDDF